MDTSVFIDILIFKLIKNVICYLNKSLSKLFF
jgi:hypothetical protein